MVIQFDFLSVFVDRSLRIIRQQQKTEKKCGWETKGIISDVLRILQLNGKFDVSTALHNTRRKTNVSTKLKIDNVIHFGKKFYRRMRKKSDKENFINLHAPQHDARQKTKESEECAVLLLFHQTEITIKPKKKMRT